MVVLTFLERHFERNFPSLTPPRTCHAEGIFFCTGDAFQVMAFFRAPGRFLAE
jgi:hypothetical protein